MGSWAALPEVYPGTEEQTCWFHKAGNVLDLRKDEARCSGRLKGRRGPEGSAIMDVVVGTVDGLLYTTYGAAVSDRYGSGAAPA